MTTPVPQEQDPPANPALDLSGVAGFDLVLALARSGDLDGCRRVLATGWPARGAHPHLAYAMLPLRAQCVDPSASYVVEQWMGLGAGDDAQRRRAALSDLAEPDLVRALLQEGADPNAAGADGATAIGRALRAGRAAALNEMVLALGERNRAPMVDRTRSLFDVILRDGPSAQVELGAAALTPWAAAAERMPDELCRAAGRALVEVCADAHRNEPLACFWRRLAVMTYAQTPRTGFSDHWIRILQHGRSRTAARWMLDASNLDVARAILANLRRNAFDFDSLLCCDPQRLAAPIPLLHAAVRMHNVGLVDALLEHGANARMPAVVNASLVTPITLAKRIGAHECVALLAPLQRRVQALDLIVSSAVRKPRGAD